MFIRGLLGPRAERLRVLPQRQPGQGMCGEVQCSAGVRLFFNPFVLIKDKASFFNWFTVIDIDPIAFLFIC